MQIDIKIDETCSEPKVIIVTNKMTEEISVLLKKLSKVTPQIIAGFREGEVTLLEQVNIIRVYASNGKVFAVTDSGEYQIRLRLYELEICLDKSIFVRVSNSEIINLKMVEKFDLSFSGTICVYLSNKTVTYVSRRYVAKIKEVLGM